MYNTTVSDWQKTFLWIPKRRTYGKGWVWGSCYTREVSESVGIQVFRYRDYVTPDKLMQLKLLGLDKQVHV